MAPKRGRPRATGQQQPAAKKPRITSDSVEERVAAITSYLNDVDCCLAQGSEEVPRDMLTLSIPYVIGDKSGSGQRHKFQLSLANMLSEVLGVSASSWQKSEQEARQRVEEAEGAHASAEGVLAEAHGRVEAQQKCVEECQSQLNSDSRRDAEADEVLRRVEEEAAQLLEEKSVNVRDREAYAAAYDVAFSPLKNGEVTAAEDKHRHVATLTSLLRRIPSETALIDALPNAIQKQPAERGVFDQMTLSQVDAVLKRHIDALEGRLACCEAPITEKAAAKESAQAASADAKRKRADSAAAFKRAEKELKSLDAVERGARKDLNLKATVISQAKALMAIQEAGARKAQDMLEAFTSLRDPVETSLKAGMQATAT